MNSFVYLSKLMFGVKDIDVLAPLNLKNGQDKAAFSLVNQIASIREKSAQRHSGRSTILEVDVPEDGGSIQKLVVATCLCAEEIIGEEFYFDYFRDQITCRFSYFKKEGENYELAKTVEKVESISQATGINKRYPITNLAKVKRSKKALLTREIGINLSTDPARGCIQSIKNQLALKAQPLLPLESSLKDRMTSVPLKFEDPMLRLANRQKAINTRFLADVFDIRSSDTRNSLIQEVTCLDQARNMDQSNHFQFRIEKEGKTYLETFQKIPEANILHYTYEVDGKKEMATYAYQEKKGIIDYVRVPRADKLEEVLSFAQDLANIELPCTIDNIKIEKTDHEGATVQFCVVWDNLERKIFFELNYQRQTISIREQLTELFTPEEVEQLVVELTPQIPDSPAWMVRSEARRHLLSNGWIAMGKGLYQRITEEETILNFFYS